VEKARALTMAFSSRMQTPQFGDEVDRTLANAPKDDEQERQRLLTKLVLDNWRAVIPQAFPELPESDDTYVQVQAALHDFVHDAHVVHYLQIGLNALQMRAGAGAPGGQ